MDDLIFVIASLAFFLVALLYVCGCASLKGARRDA